MEDANNMRLDYNLSYFQDPILLAELIAKPYESCSLNAYWDPVGFPTNGWGNLLSRVTKQQIMQTYQYSSKEADTWLMIAYPAITQDEADHRFAININKAFSSVKRLVKIPLSAGQYAALIDFTFNLGAGNLQTSTLLRYINRNELVNASNEFVKWNKAQGIILRGLTKRRLSEKKLFSLDL